jgi:hypothetical protein
MDAILSVGTAILLSVAYREVKPNAALTAMVYAMLATLVPEEHRSATLNLAFFPVYVGAILVPFIGALVIGAGLRWVSIIAAFLVLTGFAVQRRLPR